MEGRLARELRLGIRSHSVGNPHREGVPGRVDAHVGRPITLHVLRDGRTITIRPTPVDFRIGRTTRGVVGVELAESRRPMGSVGSITGGARLVSDTTVNVVKDLGHVFGPSGISRVWHLLTSNAPRRPSDPTSVVGGARLAGAARP